MVVNKCLAACVVAIGGFLDHEGLPIMSMSGGLPGVYGLMLKPQGYIDRKRLQSIMFSDPDHNSASTQVGNKEDMNNFCLTVEAEEAKIESKRQQRNILMIQLRDASQDHNDALVADINERVAVLDAAAAQDAARRF